MAPSEGRISGWQDTPYYLSDSLVAADGTAKNIIVSDDAVASLRETLL